MIIQDYSIYGIADFVAGLERAALGVLLLQSEAGQPMGTSWLITDTLAVVPKYCVSPQQTGIAPGSSLYLLHSKDRDETIKADLLISVPEGVPSVEPTLLRLREPLPDRAVKLEGQRVSVGDHVFVLQHPKGHPQAHFSIGRMIEFEDHFLRYDAATEAGSGGGPIFSISTWALVGMHTRALHQRKLNEGLSLAAILDELRKSAVWEEIASYHKLADVTAARRTLEEHSEKSKPASDLSLANLAVLWSFDPKAVPSEDRERVKSLVIDSSAPRWALQTSERERLLRSAGSLKVLRKARGRKKSSDPGQPVIDRILKGPPYRLDIEDEALLPYWLQAVRWFADVEPSLPTPAEVNLALERRRVRSRLDAIAGASFRGRVDELGKLKAWYDDETAGPMVITGIGGVGKSALVARFTAELSDEVVLLWLDFDRADLAPDDAVSVLNLVSEQASVQLPGFTSPTVEASTWEDGAKAVGAELSRALDDGTAPLLILDGFEVAQHVKQHHEIWRVLEFIMEHVPLLRVIVSGRAPVKGLTLKGRPAHSLSLVGMADVDAEAWLREHGVTDSKVLKRVLEISNCVPLVLKLAVRWVEAGGEILELPEELPKTLVEGFLYQRILDRVIDPLLKPIARDALVLRSLTEEMISKVLHDTVPEGLTPQDVFSRLTQEMSLVRGDEGESQSSVALGDASGVLRLRPEVRSATLRLLETENGARVREIDERAVNWYALQDLSVIANVAELIYHRLRIGDLKGAKSVWRDECSPLLLFAEDDLPEKAHKSRAWLSGRTGDAATLTGDLEAWEKEASERIRAALGRGLLRAVPEILKERDDRSEASPLLLFDAWQHLQNGDASAARSVLVTAGDSEGSIGRDRAVLGALLAARANDRAEADRLLVKVEREETWADREYGELEFLATQAARVRLNVDLPSEVELSKILRDENAESLLEKVSRIIAPSDAILPGLCRRVGENAYDVLKTPAEVPLTADHLTDFAIGVQTRRNPNIGFCSLHPSPSIPVLWQQREADLGVNITSVFEGRLKRGAEICLDLFLLGYRRWVLATTTLFLSKAMEQALRTYDSGALSLSIAGTLAAFRGQELAFSSFQSVDEMLSVAMNPQRKIVVPPPSPSNIVLAREIVSLQDYEDRSTERLIAGFEKMLEDSRRGDEAPGYEKSGSDLLTHYFVFEVIETFERNQLHGIILYLLGPDPLEMLCRRVVGLPNNFKM